MDPLLGFGNGVMTLAMVFQLNVFYFIFSVLGIKDLTVSI